jgi:hypothetical protein
MVTQAYWDWDRAGRPWRLSRPIKELYAQAGAAGVGRLGTIGSDDASHLKNDFPQDHTPFSATAWPDPLPGYVVCACDLADGPWSDRLLADARAGRLPWLKYLNFRGMQFSRKTGWEQRSNSDRHLHVSGMSNYTNAGLNGYNPFTGQPVSNPAPVPAKMGDRMFVAVLREPGKGERWVWSNGHVFTEITEGWLLAERRKIAVKEAAHADPVSFFKEVGIPFAETLPNDVAEVELPADFEERVAARVITALGGVLEDMINRTGLRVGPAD